ncbi:hypothetical protein [Alkalimarinus sediminis]|uniref:TIGR04086 family membrane protein n=1 Tax=Alkalimarinus sediminis TaxID=1632866 RepID=A0A9E8KQD0_9ALTE|nr:hypothetical protein [Alkalimarinus sediminis]UZW74557.1 hypothetical protein NNL22_16260 [Alkalimarinus sediminis]
MKLKWSAVVFGALIDVALSIALSFVVLIGYASILAAKGMSEAEIQLNLSDPLSTATFALVLISVGVFADAVAGYLTAKFAGYLEYWHALFMIMTVMLLHAALKGESLIPLWYEVLAQMMGVVAAFYGASIYKKSRL